MAIASVLAAKLLESRDAEAPATSPIEAAEAAPPGFLNLRLRDTALEAVVAGILRDPGAWGRVDPVRPRSVNVEFVSANPTGPLHDRQCSRRVRRRPALPRSSRRAASGSRASTTSTISGGQIRNLGASVAAIRRGEADPRGRLPRRVCRRSRRRAARRHLGRCRRAPDGATPPASSVDGPQAGSAKASRPASSARRPLRCLDERGPASRRGLGRARGRAPARTRARVRAGRRAVVPLDGVR